MDNLKKLANGCEITPHDGLINKLKLKRPLNIKLGVDPTRPDLTLGHAIVLNKLKEFQEEDHNVVLVIGSFTAGIGDPTGMDQTRPILSEDEIRENALTYVEQAGKIIDIENCDVQFNHQWLGKLTFSELIQLTRHQTVAQVLERDDFNNRFKNNRPIGIHELLYPLAQGFDSVHLQSDVEIGGSDQFFNIMVGRTLQTKMLKNNDPQICMTMPLLVGTDGVHKMSKSLGNHIALTDSPKDMFGKTMSIPDDLILPWWNSLFSDKIEQIQSPFDSKKELATKITARFHGEEFAKSCEKEWNEQFSNKGLPSDIPEVSLDMVTGKSLIDVISILFDESKSQARRLIGENAVKLNSIKTNDGNQIIIASTIIQVGKRRFIKIKDN